MNRPSVSSRARAIAGALGVSHEQVRQDLASGVNNLTPDRVAGLDGKSYPDEVGACDCPECQALAAALDAHAHAIGQGRRMRTYAAVQEAAIAVDKRHGLDTARPRPPVEGGHLVNGARSPVVGDGGSNSSGPCPSCRPFQTVAFGDTESDQAGELP